MAAAAPQIDMAMIARVLSTAQKSKGKAVDQRRQRIASLVSRKQTGPVPSPALIHRDGEADSELLDRWAELVGALPGHLQEIINLDAEGLDMPEIAEDLGVPLVTVWDRALEATAAILEAAGLPVVNRWLEAKLKEFGLLSAGAAPFACDIGWVIRHMIPRMRETAYARISCRGVDVPTVWGVKMPTFNNRVSILKLRLRLYALTAGALPTPPNMPTVPIWEITGAIDLGTGSTLMYAAVERVGLPRKGDYTWPEARLIWDAAVSSKAYSRFLDTGPVSITLPTHRIGQAGMLDLFGTMGVWVTVLDVRCRRDKVETFVAPQSGAGQGWVAFDDIISWAVPVSPAKV